MRIWIAGVEPVHQFSYVAREVIDITTHMAAQRAHGRLVATRRAAKPEIDSSRIQRIQGTELLGDHQRRMVGQHNAARTKMQRGGIGRQIANQHRGRRAGDAGHVVMFCQPVAVVAALFGQSSEIKRVCEGLFCRRSFRDRRQIQHRERNSFVSHNGSLCYRLIF